MKQFTDSAGRDWQVVINVAAVKRVRDTLNLDLLAIDDSLFGKLVGDPVLLVDLLYVLCRAQAADRGVTDEQFGEAMAGDVIDKATQALLQELVDFFPKARRTILKKVLTKLEQLQAAAIQVAHDRLADPDLDAKLEQLIRGSASTNSPASSASTPLG